MTSSPSEAHYTQLKAIAVLSRHLIYDLSRALSNMEKLPAQLHTDPSQDLILLLEPEQCVVSPKQRPMQISCSCCWHSRSTAPRQLWRCTTQSSSSRSQEYMVPQKPGCTLLSATSARLRGLDLSSHRHGYQSSVLWRKLRRPNGKTASSRKECWRERSEESDGNGNSGRNNDGHYHKLLCVSVCVRAHVPVCVRVWVCLQDPFPLP